MSANQRSTAPPFKEEFATVLRMTHSLNDAQPVPATPASFCNPTNCNIGCDDVVQNRKNESYFHKETGFRCRSLKEIKNYEKYGSPPRRHKVKTQAKEESNDKTKNETEEMVVAQRKAKAEVMRTFVEKFLSKAYYNQLHMFDP
ncbi:uncharacterized protein LOC114425925 [Glycine soja]|uniref:uncharacterized protein LOC114425925 n=1 Tax=Glycine soja TaxID=3848 RepID=UPI0010387842|nr:uncharacterized protein LOC114425925 [Glycine soja]